MSHQGGRGTALLVGAGLVVILQSSRAGWFIDDAAIGFAYARNLAEGHGLVPWPGGERIEAYSHPTWIGLLAVAWLLGMDGFTVAEPFSMLCGIATLPLVVDLTHRALPGHQGPGPALAPIALGLSAPFALWSASGLENAWFAFLLTLAVHRSTVEATEGGTPWSILACLAVTWSRPEGVLYAIIGCGWGSLAAWRRGERGTAVAIWVGWLGPCLLLEAARIAYFAWPVPSAGYAKQVSMWAWLDWHGRGWSQVGSYLSRSGLGFVVPVLAAALVGTRGSRARVVAMVVGLLALSLAWPGPMRLQRAAWWPDLGSPPAPFVTVRLLLVVGALATTPLWPLGRPGAAARSRCAAAVVASLGFWIGADGDWMGGFRFASFTAPLVSVGLAVGLAEFGDAWQRWLDGSPRWGVEVTWATVATLGLLGVANLNLLRDHRTANFDVTTAMTAKRVAHVREVAARLRWSGPVVVADMDVGGYLWHAPDIEIVDLAMLVDVPMGRHRSDNPAFLHPYIFDVRRPDLVHLHDASWSWSRRTQLMDHPAWDERYVQLRPYPDVPGVPHDPHPGLWLRRDRMFGPDPDPAFAWPLAPGWTLEAVPTFDDARPGAVAPSAGWWLPLRRSADAGPLQVAVVMPDGARFGTWSTATALLDPERWPTDAVSRTHVWAPTATAVPWVGLSIDGGPVRWFDTTLARHFHTARERPSMPTSHEVDRWLGQARAAEAAGDRATALQRYEQVLAAEPWRSWARRAAERNRGPSSR